MVNAKSRVFQPESNVFSDFYYCIIRWPIMSRIHGWKSNKQLIEELFALELNTEITITELSSRQMMIDQHVLKAAKIFPTEEAAEGFLRYFVGVKDKLQVDADTNSYDEHEQLLMDLVELHSYCNTLGNKSSSTKGKSDGSKLETTDKKSAFLETDAVSGAANQQQSADQASRTAENRQDIEEAQAMMKDLKKSLKMLTKQVKSGKGGEALGPSAGTMSTDDDDMDDDKDDEDDDSPMDSDAAEDNNTGAGAKYKKESNVKSSDNKGRSSASSTAAKKTAKKEDEELESLSDDE